MELCHSPIPIKFLVVFSGEEVISLKEMGKYAWVICNNTSFFFSVDTMSATNADKSPNENYQKRDRVSHQLTLTRAQSPIAQTRPQSDWALVKANTN